MKTENTHKEAAYLPISWDDMEVIKEAMQDGKDGKIFFFGNDGQLDEVKGTIVEILDKKSKGVFVQMKNGDRVRVDRIITIYGTVGAAYDEYEAFGNACMVCP